MNPSSVAIRAGLERGWIELRQPLTNAPELLGWLWPSIVALVVLFFLKGSTVPGGDISVGAYGIPGLLGFNVFMTGMLGFSVALITERDDGTLLRMKAIPNAMLGYYVGKVLSQAGMTAAVMLVVLVPAAFLFDGLALTLPSLLTLVWVLALGLTAVLPFGAIVGVMFKTVQTLSLVSMLVLALTGISGAFYPLGALPDWLQWIAQAFPLYWLGLGMRSALLPGEMASAEIGGSWRQLETIVVLGLWALVGFVLAPIVLRRMARRESGSSLSGASVESQRS
jgi:ABC-2 type transport system permease protein